MPEVVLLSYGRECGLMEGDRIIARWPVIPEPMEVPEVKIGKNKLRMSSGEVRKFKSQKKRDNFERVAEAYKHGWRPTGKKGKRK